MSPSSDIQAFQEALASSKSIITLAGAGLSAGSGIPTYRGPGGLWRNHDVSGLATPQGFKDHAGRVLQFHHDRRELCLKAEPNAAHRALASLCLPSTLSRIAPVLNQSFSPPLLMTQNIDSLSLRALESLAPHTKPAEGCVLEIHGSLFVTRCTSCGHTSRSYAPSLSSALESSKDGDLPINELPHCGGKAWSESNRFGRCGSLLRPSVTWFGEIPEHMGELARRLNWCDMLLVVGTSSIVYLAAGFAATVKARGGKVAVFNLETSNGDEEADFLFLGS